MSRRSASVAETILPNEDQSSTDGRRISLRPDIIRRMPSKLVRYREEGSEHSPASNPHPEAARISVALIVSPSPGVISTWTGLVINAWAWIAQRCSPAARLGEPR
jgi:hypothetical protein